MKAIEVEQLTKDYGNGKGVFDISFSVECGEVMGFLGPNGAGKTTTIRQLMGFIKPDQGTVKIEGHDCFSECAQIQKRLGYLPGEIAFMDDMSGTEFIHFIAGMRGLGDMSRAEELIEMFELDAKGRIKKMSKGMKQKIGIVCAFMHHPEILILDEPTSGLDPLMQNRFIELILDEKKNGTTILISSHMFEEVERTCDRAAIIRSGHLAAAEDMKNLKKARSKIFEIQFPSKNAAERFQTQYPESEISKDTVRISVKTDINQFLKNLQDYEIEDINIKAQTLEELFMHYYG